MPDEITHDERRREPERPKGAVALADESPDELPALLAIAVGVAILAIAIVWPTIDPLNRDDGSEAATTEQIEEAAEPAGETPSEESEEAESGIDLPAIVTGLTGLGFGDLDLSAAGAVVTATGEVADEEARTQVLDFIAGQPGVESVIDELTIAAPEIDAAQGEATVDAAQASVILTGTVPDQATADAVYERAVAVYSEEQVDNQLVVDESRTIPTQITIAGAMTDPVLFDQISTAFDDLEGVEVATRSIALEESSELETSLNSLDPIQFASGSAIIEPESAAILDEAAAFLNDNPDVAVEIGGHTDSRGSEESNQALSQARADAVKAALEERGVANQLNAVGFGERRLRVDPDDTPEAQQQNRRIEFRLL
ncbi:MAG: OmpA family protein [Acidimicrobiia bacterium]|nr:OmpA family protein [Acidimicrobiia bacterium]